MSPNATTATGDTDLPQLRTVADYQFGAGAGAALFPPSEADDLTVRRSTGGRPRQVLADGDRLVSYGTDGRFTLGVAGGRRLQTLSPPANRVVVDDESEPFVREEKNVFARFVVDCAPTIRERDEVLVVHERGDLLAVGRAELPAVGIEDFDSGVAVRVRAGVPADD